jgi:hypothetical protein
MVFNYRICIKACGLGAIFYFLVSVVSHEKKNDTTVRSLRNDKKHKHERKQEFARFKTDKDKSPIKASHDVPANNDVGRGIFKAAKINPSITASHAAMSVKLAAQEITRKQREAYAMSERLRILTRKNEEWVSASARNDGSVKIFVILTMAININIAIDIPGAPQQRNHLERRSLYERSVSFWSENSSLPIVVVETTNASLNSLRERVSSSRNESFEFLSIPPRNNHDIGAAEASAVQDALRTSILLKGRSNSDLVLKITGRYCVHNLAEIITETCLLKVSARH